MRIQILIPGFKGLKRETNRQHAENCYRLSLVNQSAGFIYNVAFRKYRWGGGYGTASHGECKWGTSSPGRFSLAFEVGLSITKNVPLSKSRFPYDGARGSYISLSHVRTLTVTNSLSILRLLLLLIRAHRLISCGVSFFSIIIKKLKTDFLLLNKTEGLEVFSSVT